MLALYKKNRNSEKTPLEDFTTELLVGILEEDNKLLDKFVNKILKIEGENFKIKSQQKYDLEDDINCIIDMVVMNNQSICFIENKVNASEGYRQLHRYSKVLNEIRKVKNQKVYLRYCTKYYDLKEMDTVDFLQYRWSEVYKFLKENNNSSYINEYLEFLRGEGMANAGDFNYEDLIVMSRINSTIAKMDECLNNIENSFVKYFEKPWSNRYKRVKQMDKNKDYCSWKENIINNENSYISLGFSFSSDSNITSPVVHVDFCINKENNKYNIFKMQEKELEKEFTRNCSDEEKLLLVYEKSLSDFLSSKDQIGDITEWFKEKLIDLKKIINNIENLSI
ncbi:TPA: PD-(D/E)XK nuclease family protein [Clostridium perfringens]